MTSKSVVNVPGYYRPIGPYSHIIATSEFLFLAMQTPMKPDGTSKEFVGKDIKEQTRQTLTNIKQLLESAGSSLENVVKVTAYLSKSEDFSGMNEVYREFFQQEPPARSVAKLGIEIPNLMVAFDVIALKGD